MKKRWKKVMAVLISAVLSAGVLAGCGGKENGTTAEEQITVTFMDGENTLGTVEAEAGSVLDASSYAAFEHADDASFGGWYGTPTFLASSKKDLGTDTFSEDTVLYGYFETENVVEDTRQWYIAGTSEQGSLAENNWASADLAEAERAQFELTPTGNPNEFSLTIDLYEGDQFQIIPDWSWDGQKGYGLFTGLDETQVENAGGLSGDSNTSNVQVIMEGSYTITLQTNPDNAAQDKLSIVRVGDIS